MHKKLMMACMAIAAFAAFVIAPVASASPVLTSNGKAVPVGTSITGKSTGTTTFTGSNGVNVHCEHGHIIGTVTRSGTPIEGEVAAGNAKFTGDSANGDCTSGLGDIAITVNSKLCLKTVTGTDTMTVNGCGANITFTMNVTSGGFACKYKATSVTGTFNTNAGATANLQEQPANLEEGGIFCPSSGKLDMDFDLYTTDGTTLTIS